MDTIEKISKHLRDEFELDEDDIQEMLDEFIPSLIEVNDKIKTALDSKNFIDLKSLGHIIKGSAINMGANEISQVGENIEKTAINEDLEGLTNNVKVFNEMRLNIK